MPTKKSQKRIRPLNKKEKEVAKFEKENYGVAVPECLEGIIIEQNLPVYHDRRSGKYYSIKENRVVLIDEVTYLEKGILKAVNEGKI